MLLPSIIFDKPRRWINSGGLGTMGFSTAAMGVQLASRGAGYVNW